MRRILTILRARKAASDRAERILAARYIREQVEYDRLRAIVHGR